MPRCVRDRGWLVGVIAAAAIGSPAACVGSSQPGVPEALLGRWYYLGSGGGLTGRGLGDAPAGYVVIHADRRLVSYQDDGQERGATRFTLHRGPTIFSVDDQWILTQEGGVAEVVTLSSDGRTLTLSENVYDGFTRSYGRVR